MFRTRDFILIFTAVVFLLVAISATVWNQRSGKLSATETVLLAEVTDREYGAEVALPELLSREEKLASMRQKIAEGGDISISSPEPIMDEESTEDGVGEEETETEIEVEISVAQHCVGYKKYSGQWQVSGIMFEVTEGARIVYRENSPDVVAVSGMQKEVVMQLPLLGLSTTNTNCLKTDVVGIAQDGSLIRNEEAGLYGVFGANTLIGYALDGFPIYGVSSQVGDRCGGQVVNGQYGYYLSDNRDVILNCFSSTPVNI